MLLYDTQSSRIKNRYVEKTTESFDRKHQLFRVDMRRDLSAAVAIELYRNSFSWTLQEGMLTTGLHCRPAFLQRDSLPCIVDKAVTRVKGQYSDILLRSPRLLWIPSYYRRSYGRNGERMIIRNKLLHLTPSWRVWAPSTNLHAATYCRDTYFCKCFWGGKRKKSQLKTSEIFRQCYCLVSCVCVGMFCWGLWVWYTSNHNLIMS